MAAAALGFMECSARRFTMRTTPLANLLQPGTSRTQIIPDREHTDDFEAVRLRPSLCLTALKDRIFVSADVSVVRFDDLEIARRVEVQGKEGEPFRDFAEELVIGGSRVGLALPHRL